MSRDLSQAVRRLRTRPGVSLLAILALALGIGANAAVFSAVDAVLLSPWPFTDPERLMMLWKDRAGREVAAVEVSHPELVDWQRQSRSFEKLAGHPTGIGSVTITGLEEPLSVPSIAVTGELFPLLGVGAAEGRLLGPADDRPGAPRVAVLSQGLRRRLFGEGQAVGRTLTIDDEAFTVAGVLPPGFRYPEGAQIWLPLAAALPQVLDNRTIGFLRVLGRLRPGVSPEQAQTELDAIVVRLAREYEPGSPPQRAVVRPLVAEILGPARQALPLLSGIVLLVLLIGCANVAHLLLAAAAARQHELAMRSVLGADRRSLLRQLLAEGLVLALAGGLAGLGLAWLGVQLLPGLAPPEMPRLDEVHVGGRVLGFALILSLLTVLVFALLPAVYATRVDLRAALGDAGSTGAVGARRGQRWMAALVAAEVAMAAVLLLGAGLLVGSFLHLSAIDPGFQPRGVLTAEVIAPGTRYPEPHQKEAFYDRLLEKLRARPGVESAALVLLRPLEGEIGWNFPFTAEGQTQQEHEANPLSNFETISPGYFRTLGIPLLAGRDFNDGDRRDAEPVAIVNQSFARRYWPDGDALGKRLKVSEPGAPIPWRRIVGIVADARYRGLEQSTLDFYVPYRQEIFFPAHVLVRVESGDPLALAGELRQAVRELDPDLPVAGITTMEERTAAQVAAPRFLMTLAGLFAALAGVLAALGIFGLISYATARRTREIGLRLALGSPRRTVLGLMARQGLLPALAGLAVGLAVAATLARGLAGLLHGIEPGEPAVFLAVGLALLAIAAAASYLPALRATRIAPSIALRQE